MAGHAGTAGTLRLVLERYVTTDVAADGIGAIRALRRFVPDCVVCDEAAWALDGAAFVRVLRPQCPKSSVILITRRPDASQLREWAPWIDVRVPEPAGLGEVLRCILVLCSLGDDVGVREHGLSRHVLAALDYLRWRYLDQVTIPGVARAAGISRGHLAERFRDEMGLTLSQYLISLRVEIAKSLLRGPRANLDEVATLAGFRGPSHLSKVFRAQTGSRPGAYRRELSR